MNTAFVGTPPFSDKTWRGCFAVPGLTGTTYRTNLVHMENNIQKARDVLAKWRDGSTPGPWTMKSDWPYPGRMVVSYETGGKFVTGHVVGGRVPEITAPLIVGTAGNPELLDAIDGLFDVLPQGERVTLWAERIAAAILAADERMSA